MTNIRYEDTINHLAKANSSRSKPPQSPQPPPLVKEDKEAKNVSVNAGPKNPPVKDDKKEKQVNGHKKGTTDGQDYNESGDDAVLDFSLSKSKEDDENSEEDSDYNSDYDNTSEESESGSSEFKRKLNDPEYTAVL